MIEKDGTDLMNFAAKRVRYCDIFANIFSVVVRAGSIITCINVCFEYFHKGQTAYFILTSVCICVPALITTILIIYMHLEDTEELRDERKKSWSSFIVDLVLLPFFFRYYKALHYSVLCKKAEIAGNKEHQRKYFDLMVKEDSDVALVRLFECYLEATPQKILQISIVVSQASPLTHSQAYTIATCFTSMTWCMASYHRCIRFSQPDKKLLNDWGSGIQCCWHFCVTVSRITTISLLISLFPAWTLLACGLHALLMTAWIFLLDRSPFCSDTCCHSLLFSAALGCVFVFTYVLPRDRPSRYRHAFFYSLCGVENLVAILVYLHFATEPVLDVLQPLHLAAIAVGSFLCGMIFLGVYYQWFHPNVVARRELAALQEQRIN